MSVAKGGRGIKAPYKSEMYRIPSPIKPAVQHLAELYRQGLWDGGLDSLYANMYEASLAALTQVRQVVANHQEELEESDNSPKEKTLVEELQEILSSVSPSNL